MTNTIHLNINLDAPDPDATIRQALADLQSEIATAQKIPRIVIINKADYLLRMDKIVRDDREK